MPSEQNSQSCPALLMEPTEDKALQGRVDQGVET